jgi:PKD repeat protein
MKSIKTIFVVFLILSFFVSVGSAACSGACNNTCENICQNLTISSLSVDKTQYTVPATVKVTGMVSGKASCVTYQLIDSSGESVFVNVTCGKCLTGKKTCTYNFNIKKADAYTLIMIAKGSDCCYQKTVTFKAVDPAKCNPCFNFSVSKRTVKCTDCSTGTITSRYWNFGDGYSCSCKNPTHTYKRAGTYTVCLKEYGKGCPNGVKICKKVTVK